MRASGGQAGKPCQASRLRRFLFARARRVRSPRRRTQRRRARSARPRATSRRSAELRPLRPRRTPRARRAAARHGAVDDRPAAARARARTAGARSAANDERASRRRRRAARRRSKPRWTRWSPPTDKTNPLGAGDWRAARREIRAFYAARDDFAGLGRRRGPHQGRRGGAQTVGARRRRRPRSLRLPPARRRRRPASRRSGSPKSKRRWRRRSSSTPMQASGSRVPPSRISPQITTARPSPTPARALARCRRRRSRRGARRLQSPAKGLPRLTRRCADSRGCAAPPRPPRRRRRRSRRKTSASAFAIRACRWCARASAFTPIGVSPREVYDLAVCRGGAAFQRATGLPPNGR